MTPFVEVARIATPLGDVVAQISCKQNGDVMEAFIIETRMYDIPAVDVMIPAHMRIDRAMRIDLSMTARNDEIAPHIEFLLDDSLRGSPESGEWLDSITFGRGRTTLNLATRDCEWMLTTGIARGLLPARFRTDDAYASQDWSIEYKGNGFCILSSILAMGEIVHCPLAFAFVTAPDDPKTSPHSWPWFAVDAILP